MAVVDRLDGRVDVTETTVAREARPAAPAGTTVLRVRSSGSAGLRRSGERFILIIVSRYRRVSEKSGSERRSSLAFTTVSEIIAVITTSLRYRRAIGERCWNRLRTTFLSEQSRQNRVSVLLSVQLLCINRMARDLISI